MPKSVNLAIVGATGLVGRAVLDVLSESDLEFENIFPLASADSEGDTVEFGKRQLTVHKLEGFDFEQVQIAIFCVPANVARDYLSVAEKAGCWIIDHSTAMRDNRAVPQVVAEVNPGDMAQATDRRIASPDSVAVILSTFLHALVGLTQIERVNVVVMHPVSSIGKRGVDELSKQSIALFNLKPIEQTCFPQQIAFNVLPDAARPDESEQRLQSQLQAILHDEALLVNATTTTVPVFYGVSMAVQLELVEETTLDAISRLIKKSPVLHGPADHGAGEMPTAVSHGANQAGIHIARLRADSTWERGINLWMVADNIRQGAAINSVQLAEILVKDYL